MESNELKNSPNGVQTKKLCVREASTDGRVMEAGGGLTEVAVERA